MTALSPILDRGRTPAEWVRLLAARGLDISERALREKANRLGACHRLGRAMLITPEQIDLILEAGRKCHSNPIAEEAPGGRAAASNTSAPPSATTIDAALAHLRKQARGNGAATRKSAGSVVTFSATKGR